MFFDSVIELPAFTLDFAIYLLYIYFTYGKRLVEVTRDFNIDYDQTEL